MCLKQQNCHAVYLHVCFMGQDARVRTKMEGLMTMEPFSNSFGNSCKTKLEQKEWKFKRKCVFLPDHSTSPLPRKDFFLMIYVNDFSTEKVSGKVQAVRFKHAFCREWVGVRQVWDRKEINVMIDNDYCP